MWHPQATISLSIFARKVVAEGMLHTRGSTPSVPVHKITLLGTGKQKDLGKRPINTDLQQHRDTPKSHCKAQCSHCEHEVLPSWLQCIWNAVSKFNQELRVYTTQAGARGTNCSVLCTSCDWLFTVCSKLDKTLAQMFYTEKDQIRMEVCITKNPYMTIPRTSMISMQFTIQMNSIQKAQMRSIITCLQSAWRNSEYASGFISLNLARKECLITSTRTSHSNTIPAFCHQVHQQIPHK